MTSPLNQGRAQTVQILGAQQPMVQIRRGVPMPEALKGRRAQPGRGKMRCYPWEGMQIGDSFLGQPGHSRSDLSQGAYDMGCKLGMTFSVREHDDGTIGVWRTK